MEPAHPSPTVHALLEPRLRAFLDQRLFCALATVDPDGAPRQAVIWYRLEDDGRIMINSRAGRRWPANLQRDGRVALAITGSDGYAWIGLTGRVDEIDDDLQRAREDIVRLAHRYYPDGPTAASLVTFRSQQRITFRIAIDGVHDHLED
jgi:PPOX class probable F420-dependent enzyme